MSSEQGEFTLGHWRQAVKGFEILYPPDEFNWDEPVNELPEIGVRFTPTKGVFYTSAAMADLGEEVTAEAQYSVVYNSDGLRHAAIVANVSDRVHLGLEGKIDLEAFDADAIHLRTFRLSLSLVEQLDSLPANTSVPKIFERLQEEGGMEHATAEYMIHETKRAAGAIALLTTNPGLIHQLRVL